MPILRTAKLRNMYISLGIAHIGITINYSFSGEVHNKNMKTWALGIFYKCTNWLGWKSLPEIGVLSTLEVCTGRMVWMVWMHKHDCEQALQGSSIESRILVDPPSADISTERASNRSARANTNTIKKSYSNTYFHKKHLSLGYLSIRPEPKSQLSAKQIQTQIKICICISKYRKNCKCCPGRSLMSDCQLL